MALETGNVPNSSEESGKPTIDIFKVVENLTRELEILKKNQQPQTAQIPGLGIEAISKIIDGINNKDNPNDPNAFRYWDESKIDPEDYDQVGVTFCSYSVGYLIVDDVRNGRPVRTPFGTPIFFAHSITQKYKVGKYEEVSTSCVYTSKSKKEIEWLRAHKHYGVRFFESTKRALSTDALKTQKIVRHFNLIDSLDHMQLIGKLKLAGLPVDRDLRAAKLELAYKLADEDLNRERSSAIERNRASYEIEPEMMKH